MSMHLQPRVHTSERARVLAKEVGVLQRYSGRLGRMVALTRSNGYNALCLQARPVVSAHGAREGGVVYVEPKLADLPVRGKAVPSLPPS
jgi:hypothetical protein